MSQPIFEQQLSTPPQPEKLPSITMLPSLENKDASSAAYMNINHHHNSGLRFTTATTTEDVGGGPISAATAAAAAVAAVASTSMPPPQNAYYLPTNTMIHHHSQHPLYHQNVVSPPLTPAVSPSSILLDSMQFKRKFSVDVGPFGFNSHQQQQQHQQQQMALDEQYRRASVMSIDQPHQQEQAMPPIDYNPRPTDYTSFLNSNIPNASLYISDNQTGPAMNQQQLQSITPIESNNSNTSKRTHHQTNAKTNKSSGTGRRNSSKRHQQQRPHKHVCKYPFCGWSFKRYEHLKRHMLVHTGERPHVCQFPGCGKSFSRSDNFHAHCRTHIKKANQRRQSTTSSATSVGKKVSRKLSTCTLSSQSSGSDENSGYNNNCTVADDVATLHSGTTHMSPISNDNVPGNNNNYTTTTAATVASTLPAAATPSNEQYHFNSQYPMFGATVPSLLNHETSSQSHSFFLPSPSDRSNNPAGLQYYQQPTAYSPAVNYSSQYPAMTAAAVAATPTSSMTHTTAMMNNNNSNNNTSTRNTTTQDCRSNQNHTTQRQKEDQEQQKSHVCPILQCQRRFKRLEHLKRHMRIHTLERPFTCNYPGCHKTFSRSDNLSQHMKTHQRHEERRRRQQQQHNHHHHQDFASLSPPSTDGISWNGPC